jgi:serine/threonine-protein kinase
MFVCTECGSSQPVAGRCAADGTPLSPIGEDVLLGTTIGVYRVARLLGIGGMGRVYKGVHPAIGSRVAIKVLSRECSDRRELVDRFFAEAKAVNLIRHEGIVNVLDLAMLPDGRPYIIMEYLDGAPLSALIDHGIAQQAPLALGGIARLIAEVLEALGAAHGKGIIHRDLKPDNIFVAPSGRPKVLDFGIAKLSDASGTSTRTGSLMGTPHYMAPEQAAGRAVDHRADIYAIGVILFECTTGRKPFLADALFDLLRMHVEAPPPSPRSLRPDMPIELEQVILTALAKPPDQRFSTTMAMSVALQRATAQLPPDQWRPLTPPSSRPAPSSNWAPTPPVSWSGQRTPPTPPTPSPGLGNAPTVSAGQVTRGEATKDERPGARARSSPSGSPGPVPGAPTRRLGLAITAALIAGGGIAAAALVFSGGGGRDTPAAGPSSTPPQVAVAGSGSAAAPDPWKAVPAPPAPPPIPAVEPPADPDDADADADGDAKPTAHTKHAAADPMQAALDQLEATIKSLPADQRKRLAAYKDLAKLPPKERMKRLQALLGQGVPDLLAAVQAEAPEPPEAPAAPRSWVTSHEIDPPGGYDPEHLDVSAFIPWAVAQAKHAIPDAQLIRIDSNGVSADGRANLKLPSLASDHGSIDLRFISPSRGKRDPSQPLGIARHDFRCEFRVMATPSGVELMPIDFADCSKERVVPVPRCSFGGVWKKAIARKAPSQNAVGNVDYRSNGSRPVWYFAIGAGFDVAFSDMFGDDC